MTPPSRSWPPRSNAPPLRMTKTHSLSPGQFCSRNRTPFSAVFHKITARSRESNQKTAANADSLFLHQHVRRLQAVGHVRRAAFRRCGEIRLKAGLRTAGSDIFSFFSDSRVRFFGKNCPPV